MGRKRNQGKARRAAKAKAREEAERQKNNQTAMTGGPGHQSLSLAQMRQLQAGGANTKCKHGYDLSAPTDIFSLPSFQFLQTFQKSYCQASERGGLASLSDFFMAAKDATEDQFADVWKAILSSWKRRCQSVCALERKPF